MDNTCLQSLIPSKRYLLTIFFTSLALLMFEVNLIRLYSVLMHHHLAFFVLSISLFGIGIGGLYAHLLKEYCDRKGKGTAWVSLLPTLLMISVLLVPIALLYSPIAHQSSEDLIPNLSWIFFAFLLCALPFVLGSMYISLIFSHFTNAANILYLSDLFGASVGCLFALFSLQFFGAINGIIFIAFLMLLPIILHPHGDDSTRLRRFLLPCALLILSVVLTFAVFGGLRLKGERYSNLLYQKWNYYSLITVQKMENWTGWRPSPNYSGTYPEHLRIRQDGRAPAFIVAFDGNFEKVEYLNWDFTVLPFLLAEPHSALVVGAGGGRDILTAKLCGVPYIRGVELNPNIASAMRNEFRQYSGNVYGMQGVDVVVENARTFLQRDTHRYDLVFTSLADTQTASNQGAQILSENHLYTTQAFEAYLDRLTDSGLCTIVTGLAEDMLRHVSSISRALQNKGVKNPQDHIIAILTDTYELRSEGLVLAFSKTPISEKLLTNAARESARLGYEVVWPAKTETSWWTQTISHLANPNTREQTVNSLKKDYSALDDDRPYLWYNTKPKDFLLSFLHPARATRDFGMNARIFYLLIQLFFVIGLCICLLMLTPMILFKRNELKGSNLIQIHFLAVFFLLGLGFMLIELSLLQHFFLLLGNPTLTFSVILGIMLSCTGFGSFLAKYMKLQLLLRSMILCGLGVLIIQTALIAILPFILREIQAMNMLFRLAAVFGIIFSLATPMGFFFPNALRLAEYNNLKMTCWAWGINGVGSVFGSVGATILAMNTGIRSTFYAGILCYLLVFLLFASISKRQISG